MYKIRYISETLSAEQIGNNCNMRIASVRQVIVFLKLLQNAFIS